MKRMTATTLCALAITAALSLPSLRAGAQTTVMPFSRNPVRGAAAGMAGSGIAGTGDLSFSAFRNPAAIPFSEDALSLSLDYSSWNMKSAPTRDLSFGTAFRTGKLGLTVGAAYNMCEEYFAVSNEANPNGSFSPFEMMLGAGASYRFTEFLSFGANLKYLRTDLAEQYSYSSLAFDAFVSQKYGDFLIATGLSDLGGKVKAYDGQAFSLPSSLTVAAGYEKDLDGTNEVKGYLDADWYFTSELSVSVGAQYTWKGMISARAGYRYGGTSVIPSFATVGAGVKLNVFTLDFAYLTGNKEIGGTFAVTAGIRF